MRRPENWEELKQRLGSDPPSFEAGADAMLNALRAKGMPTSPFMPNICKLFTLGDAPETERVIIIEQPGHIVFIPKEDKNGS